jgi:hypothetical protein
LDDAFFFDGSFQAEAEAGLTASVEPDHPVFPIIGVKSIFDAPRGIVVPHRPPICFPILRIFQNETFVSYFFSRLPSVRQQWRSNDNYRKQSFHKQKIQTSICMNSVHHTHANLLLQQLFFTAHTNGPVLPYIPLTGLDRTKPFRANNHS